MVVREVGGRKGGKEGGVAVRVRVRVCGRELFFCRKKPHLARRRQP